MSFSVHSMAGVNQALRQIDGLSRQTAAVQERIVTGLKVGSARDNGTIWAMAQGLRASNESRSAAMQSIDFATGVVEVALAAADGISDIMIEMQSKLTAASDTSLDEAGWRTLMSDYIALGNEAQILAENASFNGQNLLASGAVDLTVLVNDDPNETMTISAEDLTDGGGIFDAVLAGTLPYADDSVVTDQPDATMISDFEASMEAVNASVARLGVGLKALGVHKTLLTKTMDVTEAGIGNLVDADLGREKAKLEAMLVREQLGVQALSLANQAPRTILSFFR